MSAWYYVDEHRQTVGPLPQDRLISLLNGMARPGEVFVWCVGFDSWKRAAEVEHLFPPPKVAQPLPPVPQVQSESTRAAAGQHDAKGARAANTAWAKETLQGTGAFLLVLAIGIGSVTLIMMLFYGAAWASEHLLRYVSLAAQWAIVVCVVLLAPLSAFRKTRVVSAFGFFSSSYIFGTCLWMIGLLTAYFYWGLKSIIIGMCMFGVGVVPVALWTALSMMLIGVVLTYGPACWHFGCLRTSDQASV